MVWVTVAPTLRQMSTETMATYMVQQGQFAGQPGYGSAIAVILFFISLTIALGYQRLALRRDLAGSVTRGVR
ncbi:MAG: sugar ABC transporter permease [Tetrasphaera sp.]|nr:sugar ABC transporter permease [Tetrasphaera sp.]